MVGVLPGGPTEERTRRAKLQTEFSRVFPDQEVYGEDRQERVLPLRERQEIQEVLWSMSTPVSLWLITLRSDKSDAWRKRGWDCVQGSRLEDGIYRGITQMCTVRPCTARDRRHLASTFTFFASRLPTLISAGFLRSLGAPGFVSATSCRPVSRIMSCS